MANEVADREKKDFWHAKADESSCSTGSEAAEIQSICYPARPGSPRLQAVLVKTGSNQGSPVKLHQRSINKTIYVHITVLMSSAIGHFGLDFLVDTF